MQEHSYVWPPTRSPGKWLKATSVTEDCNGAVIHLQFCAYGSWDSLFPISISQGQNYVQKMQDAQVTKSLMVHHRLRNSSLIFPLLVLLQIAVHTQLLSVCKVLLIICLLVILMDLPSPLMATQ